MTARERILMIRLMEKLEKYPAYAMLLGIEATGAVNNQKKRNEGPHKWVRPFAFIERRE